jgi:hypothetical protein
MEILTGKYKGMTGELRQFANGWMTVDIEGERPNVIVRPNEVKLNEQEMARVRSAPTRNVGTFWEEWQMYDDGTFVPRNFGRPITLGSTGRLRSGRRPRS